MTFGFFLKLKYSHESLITVSFIRLPDLIESLSEDRARLLEEKKKLEEEVSKLRGSTLVPSPYAAAAPELYGACAPEFPGEADSAASEAADEGRMDSAMETSMVSVQ